MKDMMQYLTQRAAQKVQQDNERIRRSGQSSKRMSVVIAKDTSSSMSAEGHPAWAGVQESILKQSVTFTRNHTLKTE